MDEAPFEVIEHTADVGIVAYGATLEEVFAHAAEGMLSFLIPPATVHPRERRRIAVEAEDVPGLLVAWLNELLVLLNAHGFVPRSFDVREVSSGRVEADVWGEPVDPERHRFRLDVKAATYHQLEVRRNGRWRARVIFDV
jgi:SHS2 domain-containing protein